MPFQSDSFQVQYHVNGAAAEYYTFVVIDYHNSHGIPGSVLGMLQANEVTAYQFNLPDTIYSGLTDSVPTLNLDTISPYVYLYGTIPITSYVPEATRVAWQGGQTSGEFFQLYSDAKFGALIPGDTTINCPFIYVPVVYTPYSYENLSSLDAFTALGDKSTLNYNIGNLDVESVVSPVDSGSTIIDLFHNQTIAVPLPFESTDSTSFDTLSFVIWLRNHSFDSLKVRVAQLWLGTNYIDSIPQVCAPVILAPKEKVEVDVHFRPSIPRSFKLADSTYYYYVDYFIVETDSSYHLPLSTTSPDRNAIPQAKPLDDVREGAPVQTETVNISPNPTSSNAMLQYYLLNDGPITIAIFDALGRVIQTPVENQWETKGVHSLRIAIDNLPAGLYTCRINAGGKEMTAKLMVTNH